MGVTGIGVYQQPYTTPLSSGPAAAQQTKQADPNQEAQAADEARRQQGQQNQTQQNQAQQGGGYTTPTRGQNLNITA
ncbi:hypothetical protein [Azospirillum soli]|uniref:hypothetical protein n=1 Tax=Azospirillum soli TaxID=1304799 RepID=UPI001AE98F04|nr:hypothetical protein [Azospirillum soli]